MASPVSVIIPVYNRPEFLPEAVASLIETRYPSLEIVIVDDGSSDDTLVVARQLEERFPRLIRVLQHVDAGNHGPGASRNLGVQQSAGGYVCFLDSDDIVLPNRFQIAVPMLDEDPGVDGVAERFLIQETEGAPPREVPGKPVLAGVVQGPGILWHTNTILLRRRCFLETGGFSERLRTCEDLTLWIKLSLSAHIVAGGSDPVVINRRHEGNTDLILQNSLLAHLEALGWMRDSRLDRKKIAALREVTWGKMLFVCDRLMRRGDSRLAIRMLGAAAYASPFYLLRTRYWRNLLRALLSTSPVRAPMVSR